MRKATTYTVTVPQDKDRLRLDRFLADALEGLSRNRLKKLIEDSQVSRVGDVPGDPVVDVSAKVRTGEVYAVTVPAVRPAVPLPQAVPFGVVYEDEDLIVIDKPVGLVVHPAAGHPDGTLVNGLLAHCAGSLSGVGGVTRPGIVHRLDKDTSGLMVAAKNDSAHQHLARQLETRTLSRRYKALVWGTPEPRQGEIEAAIGRNPANRKKMAVVKRGGKAALTRYRVLKPVGAKASLVECRLSSGRTHQIRVHMAHLGHPVIGDPLYGGGAKRRLNNAPDAAGHALAAFNHQALHAYLIGFEHPSSGKSLRFESNLPIDFKELKKSLEKI
ncbi:MAG TPA: RluA family pseudouridine synthase [Rhodospirillales bacterium]|nr:RluA family pseudouridine synthase [Rhodospirillales bacterium]